jgi:hypothetical protein
MALVAAIGLSAVTLANSERAASRQLDAGMGVRYGADAMAVRTVNDLILEPDWTTDLGSGVRSSFSDTTLEPATAWHDVLDLSSMTADLQQQTDAASGLGMNAPRWHLWAWGSFDALVAAPVPAPPAYLVAWIADDPAEGDNDPSRDSNAIVTIRAEAFGMSNLRRAVQVVLRRPVPPETGPTTVVSWREVT